MNREEYRHLIAEKGTLEHILGEIPETEALDRGSFLSRLGEVNRRISSFGAEIGRPVRARLTFRGRPVIGTHGIFAEFGMNATKAFADAVSTMAAALSGPLASSGPIPDREQNRLLITNTALGSFGFELEEHREGQFSFGDESPVAQALRQTQQLFQGSVGTDDELADAATGANPRVIGAFRSFLGVLAESEATCAVEFNDRRFSFRDVGEVRRSFERLGQENLREEPQHLEGEFQGILPKRRTFEFKLAGSEQVITGKIGPEIGDPDSLNNYLHLPARIDVLSTRVGNGRPRYTLSAMPAWTKQS